MTMEAASCCGFPRFEALAAIVPNFAQFEKFVVYTVDILSKLTKGGSIDKSRAFKPSMSTPKISNRSKCGKFIAVW